MATIKLLILLIFSVMHPAQAHEFLAEDWAKAKSLPTNAITNGPFLAKHLADKWPSYEYPWFIFSQVEQETCISLKHSKCWSEKAELKTSRELGFGLGQLTIAYDKAGKERFNAFAEVKRLDAALADWKFEDRFDANKQLLAVVIRDKFEYSKIAGAANALEHSAFFFNSYNGGPGGMLQDRRLCKATAGCDPAKWFGNVENTSYKSRVAVKGYGKSFFEISREYPRNIIYVRSPRYKPYFTQEESNGKPTSQN